MPSIEFTVTGLPVPQGSLRAILPKRSARPVVIHARSQALAVWRASVAYAAQRALGGLPPVAVGPVALSGMFILPRPRSAPQGLRTAKQRLQWERPWRKPDLDKLTRALLDGLTGVLFADDGQVVHLNLSKAYGPTPGAKIRAHWSDDVAPD